MNATKSIYNISLLDVLPPSILDDENIVAAAKTLDLHLQQFSTDIKKALHLPRLAALDHSILDLLAEQYHVDFYEPERMAADTKRRLIAESLHQHFKLGTRYAVEKLLNTLSSNANLFEWYEYDAQPYHFKIAITGLRDLDDNGERIMRAIDVTKNVRSHCDAFDFRLNQDNQNLYVAQLQLDSGNISADTDWRVEDRHNLQAAFSQLTAGRQSFELVSNERQFLQHTPRAAFIVMQTGKIKFPCDTSEIDSESYELYLLWLKTFWRRFNLNPVVKHYGDFDEPDEDWDETQMSGNFVKLYFNFHKSDESRLIVMNFARDDICAADVNSFPADGVLRSRRGYLSDKIYRAVYVTKTVTRLDVTT